MAGCQHQCPDRVASQQQKSAAGQQRIDADHCQLIIARLSPKGYEEISRAQLIQPTTGQLPQRGGVCWSHPAFANRCVFVRNDEELLCVDLAQKQKE